MSEEIESWFVEDRFGRVEVVDKRDFDDVREQSLEKSLEIEKLKQRIKFLETDAVKTLEKQLEDKRNTARVVYKWLSEFAEHDTLGKAWCGWLDDSYGAIYRIWKE